MVEYEQMKAKVLEIEQEVIKAEGGNKAAGTRVRQTMQEVKTLAQTVRQKILELRASSTGH
jgi:hypothetical protein